MTSLRTFGPRQRLTTKPRSSCAARASQTLSLARCSQWAAKLTRIGQGSTLEAHSAFPVAARERRGVGADALSSALYWSELYKAVPDDV